MYLWTVLKIEFIQMSIKKNMFAFIMFSDKTSIQSYLSKIEYTKQVHEISFSNFI